MSYPPPPPPYQPPHPPQGPPYLPPGGAYPPPRRSKALPVAIAVGLAVLVLAAAVLVPLLLLSDDDTDDAARDRGADPESPSVSVDTTDLDEVREYDGLEPAHVEGDLTYDQAPPVGGTHNTTWLECGVYDVPVREENVVHDLEHGTVWITYREDQVDEAGRQALADRLPQNGILSPYPEQQAPVVVTVWGRQLDLLGPDDARLGLFIDEYEGGVTAPEPFASCAGGTTDPGGGLG
jgi:hypothetical protein